MKNKKIISLMLAVCSRFDCVGGFRIGSKRCSERH